MPHSYASKTRLTKSGLLIGDMMQKAGIVERTFYIMSLTFSSR